MFIELSLDDLYKTYDELVADLCKLYEQIGFLKSQELKEYSQAFNALEGSYTQRMNLSKLSISHVTSEIVELEYEEKVLIEKKFLLLKMIERCRELTTPPQN